MTLILIALVSLCQPALSANPNSPHPHQGVAEKFTNPQRTQLSESEEASLLSGNSIRRQSREGDSGGRGIAIMDVAATPDTIWAVIHDFGNYPNWIDQLSSCEIYRESGGHVYVDFTIKTMGMTVQYYIDHTFSPEAGHITWQLDYTRESDLDDSTGYWLVYPSPNRPGYSRVEYSVDLRTKGWVPGFIEDMLANKGLEDATTWVSQQAEAR